MPQYALRFISGKYQGGEFPLENKKEVVIGRGSDLDMVLVEDMVSRRHATITVTPEGLTIADHGSTNGTFVNGERVERCLLKDGDRVLIGTSILKVVAREAGRSHDTDSLEQTSPVVAPERRSTMTGTIEEVSLPDLLQLFSTSQRTGVLRIRGPEGEAEIYLRDGNIYYACINADHDLGPMKAMARIVAWTRGNFEFCPPPAQSSFMLELEDPTEAILMEALRQLDEYRRHVSGLPKPKQKLIISRPLTPLLSELNGRELDVLRLVWNHGTMMAIMDRAPGWDYETAQAIQRLLSDKYIEIENS